MEQHATNVLEPAIKRRKRAVSPKIVHAIELIASGRARTQSEAASMAGVSEEWLSKMLGRQEMGVLLEQTCRKYLRKGSVRATARLVELLDSPSARTSLEASKHVLGIHGIRPPPEGVTVSASVHLSVGYVIDLRPPGDDAPLTIDATPTDQSSAELKRNSKEFER